MNKSAKSKSRSVYYKRKDGGLIFSFNRENPQDKKVYESMRVMLSLEQIGFLLMSLENKTPIGLIIENPLNKDAKKKDPLMFRGYYTQEYRDQVYTISLCSSNKKEIINMNYGYSRVLQELLKASIPYLSELLLYSNDMLFLNCEKPSSSMDDSIPSSKKHPITLSLQPQNHNNKSKFKKQPANRNVPWTEIQPTEAKPPETTSANESESNPYHNYLYYESTPKTERKKKKSAENEYEKDMNIKNQVDNELVLQSLDEEETSDH